MSDWIDVNERMPEDEQRVIATVDEDVAEVEYHKGKFFYVGRDLEGVGGSVSAWMPLPEPYDPNKKEDVNDYNVDSPFWLKDEIKEGCNYRLVFGDQIVDFYAMNNNVAESYCDYYSNEKSYALYKLDEGKLKILMTCYNDDLE